MITFAISNIKGGVAKTTTAATLASGLHDRGYRVLMIDSDPQTNLTMCFTNEPDDDDPTLYHLYSEGKPITDLRKEIKPGLDLVTGDFTLCGSDWEFLGQLGSLKWLRKAMKSISEEYDYAIIDTPPNLGFLSLNAFIACDYIITPMAAESFSFKAIRLLRETIDKVEDDTERKIPVIGILVTRYMDRANISKACEKNIDVAADTLETQVFKSRIRQTVVVQESQLVKMSLFEYAAKAMVTMDYNSFIDELLERIGGGPINGKE